MKKLVILIVAMITALAGIAPAQAFPVMNIEKPQAASSVELVRDQRIIRRYGGPRFSNNYGNRNFRYDGNRNYGNRYYGNRDRYFGNRYYGDRFYGNRYYGNRYYGNRYYGNGYYGNRRYYGRNDAGIFFGGLAAGAIIGGALNSTPRYYGNNSHTRWCYARYRSYRAYDNTYQPNYGPRRQCVIR